MKNTIAITLLLLIAAPLAADELITDRPDQTESAAVAGKGRVQIETGFLFTANDEDGLDSEVLEGPGTLARIGLSERFELRVGWTGFVDSETDFTTQGQRSTSRADGIGDGDLGFKLRLRSESGRIPEMALLAGTSVPVGDDQFTSDRADPYFRLSMAHTLSDRVSIGYNFGAEWGTARDATGNTTTLARGIYTVAMGFGLTDRWGAFVEVFGDVALSEPGGPAHSIDGGFSYLVRPTIQLDAYTGVGLNDRGDDWFLGIGLSIRLGD